jgi:formylglycine-generating enzyme required for sulfatase activity
MRSNPSKIKSRTVQKRGGMSPFQAVPNMIEQEEPLPLNPVENVTWAMAMEFCRKLEAKEKAMAKLPDSAVLRLPTEAEWWAAATGASAALGERFEWFSDKGKGHRALTADAKDDLVYDLFGNVAEWCVDAWSDALPPNGAVDFVTVVNSFPLAPAAEGAYSIRKVGDLLSRHVVNGGSFRDPAGRFFRIPGSAADEAIGFRVVLGFPIGVPVAD